MSARGPADPVSERGRLRTRLRAWADADGIFALLLPVWRVDVQATVTDAEDYALIDRYLERGIASAGLDTRRSLASFWGWMRWSSIGRCVSSPGSVMSPSRVNGWS